MFKTFWDQVASFFSSTSGRLPVLLYFSKYISPVLLIQNKKVDYTLRALAVIKYNTYRLSICKCAIVSVGPYKKTAINTMCLEIVLENELCKEGMFLIFV